MKQDIKKLQSIFRLIDNNDFNVFISVLISVQTSLMEAIIEEKNVDEIHRLQGKLQVLRYILSLCDKKKLYKDLKIIENNSNISIEY